jgi:hypothetical protein
LNGAMKQKVKTRTPGKAKGATVPASESGRCNRS